MNDLDQPLRDILSGYSSSIDCGQYDEAIADIKQALEEAGYKEEKHTNALTWYTRLTNDLINDDELKRSEHVGRILEYARIAAGLTEEDVKIVLPDEYIPHDPDFVAEHISPVLEVSNKPPFEEGTVL